MQILVGSQALAQYIPGVKPRDTDYFSDASIPGAEVFYHPILEKYQWENGVSNSVATLDELYTIKVSHSYWELRNGSWSKHVKQMMEMKAHGAHFIPELHDLLYKIWEETHGRKRANLEKPPEEFFTETVERIYEHDSIHAAVAYGEEPLFKKILRDGHQVAVSREKFDALNREEQLNLVREEVFATALERRVIPAEGEGWRSAYPWALKMTLTSFTKGWFATFIALNFEELCQCPLNYWERMEKNKRRLIPLEK